MKVYLEAEEIRPVGDIIQPEYIRLEVTSNTEAEQDAILTALKSVMAGISCIYYVHTCGHIENKTCNREVIWIS